MPKDTPAWAVENRGELFAAFYRRPPVPWQGMLLSLGGHALALSFLIFVLPILPERTQPVRPHEVRIEPLILKVPDQLLVARSSGSPKPAPPNADSAPAGGARRAGNQRRGRQGEAGRGVPRAASRAGARPAPRLFELPEIPRRRPAPQLVLQPALPLELELKAETRLPQLLLWAPVPRIAPPPAKRFIAPGSPAPPKTPLVLDAPPRLDRPNVETALADLKLASSTLFAAPRLPVPPASVAPIRQFVAPEARRPEPSLISDPFPGEPTNLLALSATPVPLKESLVLQRGNLLGDVPPPSEAGGPGGGGGASDAGAGRGSEAGGAVEASGVSPSLGEGGPGRGGVGGTTGAASGSSAPGEGAGKEGPGSGAASEGVGSGAASGGAAGSAGAAGRLGSVAGGAAAGESGGLVSPGAAGLGGAGTGSATGTGTGAGASPAGTGMASGLPSSVPTRIEHPVTAVFDIVVEGAAPLAGQSAGAGILSGKPVYTVYLPVGVGRQWMLQYCIPRQSAGPRVSGGVVSLGSEPPLRAPFPRTMIIPPADLLPAAKTLLVHGYIDAKGEFQQLRAVSEREAPVFAALLPHLQGWVFRPAVRGGTPVQVEILLMIPAAAR